VRPSQLYLHIDRLQHHLGGTKGIGRVIVRSFLEEGATVHFCSRTKADVEAANSKLATDFPNAKAIGSAVDISNQDEVAKWVSSSADQSGGIDVLVSNVSALAIPDTPESWQASFQTDLLALHTMVQTAIPYLEKSKGNIVAISSVSGRDIDFTTPGPYGPVKAAVIHYTASLARKLASKGVRANTCSPGNIYIEDGVWGGVEKNMPELFKSQMALNPMGRMGKPEEIANTVLFLASEKASFVSGANFVVDGALCNGVQF
jgi:NAD(P)-dependent dehydrogenase (short-subunit alcohol dehydrogenase family)